MATWGGFGSCIVPALLESSAGVLVACRQGLHPEFAEAFALVSWRESFATTWVLGFRLVLVSPPPFRVEGIQAIVNDKVQKFATAIKAPLP